MWAGTELKLADAVHVDMSQLCQEMSADILGYQRPDLSQSEISGMLETEPQRVASTRSSALADDPTYFPNWSSKQAATPTPQLELEPDGPDSIDPVIIEIDDGGGSGDVARLGPAEQVQHQQPEHDAEVMAAKIFPNSFKVAGLKHVCDNLLQSTLASLPQCPV